jgi:hypothetical protein
VGVSGGPLPVVNGIPTGVKPMIAGQNGNAANNNNNSNNNISNAPSSNVN